MSRIAEPIYAATSAHRLACEARELLRWPLDARRAYLADIERLRGKPAAEALREALKTEHTAAQNAKHSHTKGPAA